MVLMLCSVYKVPFLECLSKKPLPGKDQNDPDKMLLGRDLLKIRFAVAIQIATYLVTDCSCSN